MLLLHPGQIIALSLMRNQREVSQHLYLFFERYKQAVYPRTGKCGLDDYPETGIDWHFGSFETWRSTQNDVRLGVCRQNIWHHLDAFSVFSA